ncbi:hypothetical protein [Longimicrobium sp.]|uniref:hypothetical protein n=1 Tax=Longimicrobium sp. TaxID=2029185 RepID=UPI003B3ABC8D
MIASAPPQIPPDVRDAYQGLSPAAERFLEHLLEHPEEGSQLEGFEKGLPPWMIFNDITRLTWPTFVDARRVAEMERATAGVCRLIKAIPAVVFGGDLDAIARFYGYEDPGMLEILFAAPNHTDSTVARCDFIDTPDGLKCCEVNMATNLGGWEHRFWSEHYLPHPVITDFCAREGITPRGRDVLLTLCEHMIDDALNSRVIDEGGELNVMMALDVEPSEEARRVTSELYAELLRRTGRGITGELWLSRAPADELVVRGTRVYRGERRVHVFYGYTNEPVPTAVLRAQIAGAIRVYNGGLTYLWVDKRNLALLSENEALAGWKDEYRALIRDHIPWTRLVSARTTTWRGEAVQFPGFLLEHRDDMVLKLGRSSGGADVHVGRYITPEAWEARVREAVEQGGWIVQERVESRPYLYPPRPGAAPVPQTVVWGLFCTGWRYAGGWLRMLPQGDGEGIVNCSRGASESGILEV